VLRVYFYHSLLRMNVLMEDFTKPPVSRSRGVVDSRGRKKMFKRGRKGTVRNHELIQHVHVDNTHVASVRFHDGIDVDDALDILDPIAETMCDVVKHRKYMKRRFHVEAYHGDDIYIAPLPVGEQELLSDLFDGATDGDVQVVGVGEICRVPVKVEVISSDSEEIEELPALISELVEVVPEEVAEVRGVGCDDCEEFTAGNAMFSQLITSLRCFSCQRLGVVLPVDYSLFSFKQWRSFLRSARRSCDEVNFRITSHILSQLMGESANRVTPSDGVAIGAIGKFAYDAIVDRAKPKFAFVGHHTCCFSDTIFNCLSAIDECMDKRSGAWSCFLAKCCEGYVYAVFSEEENRLVPRRVTTQAIAGMIQSFEQNDFKQGWFVLSESMLVSYSAQGACIDILHWLDSRLPECQYVVRDSGVFEHVLEQWKNERRWPVLSGYNFAHNLPAIGYMSGNYCEYCGGVDMCRHILAEILGDELVDLQYYMELAESGVFNILKLKENPLLISLSSPHIRYAIGRSLQVTFKDARLDHWVAACEDMCFMLYPHRIVAQSFYSEAFEALTSSLSAVCDLFMYIPNRAARVFGDLIGWVVSKVKDFLTGGVMFMVDAVFKAISDKVESLKDDFRKVFQEFKPIILALVKTLVRVAMGYSAVSVLLELAWDSSILSVTCSAVKAFMPDVVSQGVQDFGAVVTALGIAVFVGLGKAYPNMRFMSDILTSMIAAAGAFNRAQLWEQFMALFQWYEGDEKQVRLEYFRGMYPASVSMVDMHLLIIESLAAGKSVVSLRNYLGAYYAKYLVERRSFGPNLREMSDLVGPAVRYINTTGVYAIDQLRRRPACFIVHGPTNVGKSRLIARIGQLIAQKHCERYSPGGVFSFNNAMYNVDVGDQYASGYDNQDIWVFDEWGQEIDSEQNPSKSVDLLFTLISTQPNRLNMAACDDKGKVAMVNLVLGASNQPMTDANIKVHVKSKCDAEAVCSRIKYRVSPILKPPYYFRDRVLYKVVGDASEVVDRLVPEEELFEFEITLMGDVPLPGDLKNGRFSWKALVNLANDEYEQCVNYDPNSIPLDMSIFDSKEDEKAEAQEFHAEGLWNYVSKLWSLPEKREYFDLSGKVLGDDLYEVYDNTAQKVFRVCECPDSEEVEFPCAEGVRVYRGIYVYVKESLKASVKNVGFALLLLIVGIIGVMPIARKLISAANEVAEVASVVWDGVRYWWDPRKGCYTSQGVMIEKDGRMFKRVSHKGGYEWYPQGLENKMIELLDNHRTIQQMPSIYDSVFCVISKGLMIGNAFAVTDSRLVLPNHVAINLCKNGGDLWNGRVRVSLPAKNSDGGCKYFVECVKDDCAVLCLERDRLNGIRNQFSKLIKFSPRSGLCRQVYRDGTGELHTQDGTFMPMKGDVNYATSSCGSYSVPEKSCRMTGLSGFSGICGALYVNVNESNKDNLNGGVVMGFHIAADETANSRVFRTFDDLTFSLNAMFSTALPPLDNPKGGLGEFYGMESSIVNSGLPVHPMGRLGKTPCPPIPGCSEYGVAVLRPRVVDGVERDAFINSFENLANLSKRDIKIPERVVKVSEAVAKKLCLHAIIHKPNIADTFSGGGLLPSLNRQAAVGPPLNKLGPNKDVLCLSERELSDIGLENIPVPTAECVEMMQELLDRIKTGGMFDGACNVSLKEEPRLQGKIDQDNTRIFAGSPGHEFLLQRMYFLGVAATFLKKNLLVHSALGLEPSDGRKLHDWLLRGLKNPKILTADFKKQDQSFSPDFFILVERILRSIALGYVVGDDVVNEDDFIRKCLIRRLAFNRLLVGRTIVEPKGGHPSGSFLTTLFNIICDIICFTDGLSVMMNCTPEEIDEYIRMVFLGDDSTVAVEEAEKYDPHVLVNCAAEYGFTITSNDKLGELRWEEPYDYEKSRSEYTFLGRHFTESVSVLELDRLSKMMQFCEVRRVLEVYPQSILSYRQEVAFYAATGQKDWVERCWVQVQYFGFKSMEEFLSVSNAELQGILLGELSRDATKMHVTLPPYNRIVAQGLDGEPDKTDDLGDVEFISNVSAEDTVTDEVPNRYLQDHMDETNYAPPDVFKRAIVTVSGLTGTVAGIILSVIAAPSSFFYRNFNAQAKMCNFIFMRCRFCCKVIVASGPFVSGKLIMGFRPGPNNPTNIYQMSGDPCTEIDLSSAKSGVIKYDIVMPGNWMMIENFSDPISVNDFHNNFDFGVVTLATLTNPSVSVAYTQYTWLEDVELRGVGYTLFTLAPQGAKGEGKKEVKKASVSKDYMNTESGIKWQWRVENTPDWLNTTAASVETTGGMIECIETSILGPLGDFIDAAGEGVGAAASVGALMGCSAPVTSPHFDVFAQAPNWAQSQMICQVPAMKLAAVQSQKIVMPRGIFGNRGDEMGIYQYACRMGVLGLIGWTGSNPVGTLLWSWDVMPGVTPPAPVIAGAWTINPIPINFVCGMMRMWRGSIKYRLSIAKTAFHTGVLEVVWQMGYANSPPASSYQDALLHRYVWDITKSSSIEFEIPYIARSPWTQIYYQPWNNATIMASDQTSGCLRIGVVNPLQNSSGTVASNVQIVVYCGAGKDFELSVPGRQRQVLNFPPPGPRAIEYEGESEKQPVAHKFVAQGGPFGDDAVSDELGGVVIEKLRGVVPTSLWAHMTTVGERVLSMRMLIKRFGSPIGIPTLAGSVSALVMMRNTFFLAYISQGFTFWSGSMRADWQISGTDWVTEPAPFRVTYFWNNYSLTFPQDGNGSMTISPYSNMTVCDLPWYSPIAFRIIGDTGPVFLTCPTGFVNSTVAFAAGDDFSFGFQVGPPPMTFSTTIPAALY
jgi:hypothetical protein